MYELNYAFEKGKDGHLKLWWNLIKDGETIATFKELEFAEKILEVARRYESIRLSKV